MIDLVEMVLTPTFVFLCLAISAIVFMVKKVVDKFYPKNPLFAELILPILPLIIGGLIMLGKYPVPVEFTHGKILYGIVCGLLSGLVYRIVKAVISGKYNVSASEE